jgi:hypothetical protein
MGKRTAIRIDNSQMLDVTKHLDSLAADVSKYVRKHAVPRATALVKATAIQLAPRGKPSDRAKQSSKHRRLWAKARPLADVVVDVVRDYGQNNFTAFVGAEHPFGNKAYFDYHGTKSRRRVYWGRQPVRGPKKKRKRRWMVQVMDTVGHTVVKIYENTIKDAVAESLERK